MADDTNITPSVEIASADASTTSKEKKTRAPRKPKIVAQVVASVSAPAKKTRGPGRKSAASDARLTTAPAARVSVVAEKPAVAKAQPAKRAPRQAATAAHDTDGFADLLKLEEENQKLRKALSEKLRGENADLRKKLGIA